MIKNTDIILVNTISDFIRLGNTSRTFVFGNSSYTFYKNSVAQKKSDWSESRQRCKDTGSDLVSIESEKEWNFLKNSLQKMKTIEFYIGLKKDSKSGEWKWISDNSKVIATRGKFPWATAEPSGDGNCAVMYKDYGNDYGLFNDWPCDKQNIYSGYICESPTKSTGQEGMSYKLLRILLRLHWTPFFFSNSAFRQPFG